LGRSKKVHPVLALEEGNDRAAEGTAPSVDNHAVRHLRMRGDGEARDGQKGSKEGKEKEEKESVGSPKWHRPNPLT
jgi:hypothetical protein